MPDIQKNKNFFTLTRLRRLGNAMALTFGTATLPAILSENKKLTIVCWALGITGQFITVLFKNK